MIVILGIYVATNHKRYKQFDMAGVICIVMPAEQVCELFLVGKPYKRFKGVIDPQIV